LSYIFLLIDFGILHGHEAYKRRSS
jgi:hypothetical protein